MWGKSFVDSIIDYRPKFRVFFLSERSVSRFLIILADYGLALVSSPLPVSLSVFLYYATGYDICVFLQFPCILCVILIVGDCVLCLRHLLNHVVAINKSQSLKMQRSSCVGRNVHYRFSALPIHIIQDIRGHRFILSEWKANASSLWRAPEKSVENPMFLSRPRSKYPKTTKGQRKEGSHLQRNGHGWRKKTRDAGHWVVVVAISEFAVKAIHYITVVCVMRSRSSWCWWSFGHFSTIPSYSPTVWHTKFYLEDKNLKV